MKKGMLGHDKQRTAHREARCVHNVPVENVDLGSKHSIKHLQNLGNRNKVPA